MAAQSRVQSSDIKVYFFSLSGQLPAIAQSNRHAMGLMIEFASRSNCVPCANEKPHYYDVVILTTERIVETLPRECKEAIESWHRDAENK
jgi:hypothetical protein